MLADIPAPWSIWVMVFPCFSSTIQGAADDVRWIRAQKQRRSGRVARLLERRLDLAAPETDPWDVAFWGPWEVDTLR